MLYIKLNMSVKANNEKLGKVSYFYSKGLDKKQYILSIKYSNATKLFFRLRKCISI